MADKFIIELDRNEIEFVAAMTHLYLKANEGDETALAVLHELVMQTNCVYSDAAKHGISSSLMVNNKTPATKWGTNIINYLGDGTGLSDIMIHYTGD